jgi:hypothetical protein
MTTLFDKKDYPVVGDTYYDQTSGSFYVHNGIDWSKLAPPKTERFIFFKENHAVISDYKFYNQNQLEIEQWCDDNCEGWSREGMVMHFPNAEDRMMFALRWAG